MEVSSGYGVEWKWWPAYPLQVRRVGPPSLVTEFDDGTEIRRRKGEQVRRVVTETHILGRAELQEQLQFFEEKGTDVAFSRLTWDAADPEDQYPGTFRFRREPEYVWQSATTYVVRYEFIEVL